MSYAQLNAKFPLRSIRTTEQHSAAVAVITDLSLIDLTDDEIEYVSALADLIEFYESEVLEPVPQASPKEALRYLLDVNGLRPKDIADLVSPPHTSAILSGTRKISKTEAARLGAFFKVDPMLFVDKVVPFAPPNTKTTSAQETSRRSAKSPKKLTLQDLDFSEVRRQAVGYSTAAGRFVASGSNTKSRKTAAKKAGTKVAAKAAKKPAARKAGKKAR
jgi:HTH-type transcriptional regulator/antitoxin HigA